MIVGILTLTSMINTTSERINAKKFSCRYISFYELMLILAWKSFITSGSVGPILSSKCSYDLSSLQVKLQYHSVKQFGFRSDPTFCLFPVA